jgi:hypothetical protein
MSIDMKTKLLWSAIVLLLVTNMVSYYRIQQYEAYYQGAEELLDTLENHYNWVDAIDNEAYYSAVGELSNH